MWHDTLIKLLSVHEYTAAHIAAHILIAQSPFFFPLHYLCHKSYSDKRIHLFDVQPCPIMFASLQAKSKRWQPLRLPQVSNLYHFNRKRDMCEMGWTNNCGSWHP